MDDSKTDIAALKTALEVLVVMESVNGVIAFAVRAGKQDFLANLNKLITDFLSTLSEQERVALKEGVDRGIDAKAKEVLTQLGMKLTDDELTEVLNALEQIK